MLKEQRFGVEVEMTGAELESELPVCKFKF